MQAPRKRTLVSILLLLEQSENKQKQTNKIESVLGFRHDPFDRPRRTTVSVSFWVISRQRAEKRKQNSKRHKQNKTKILNSVNFKCWIWRFHSSPHCGESHSQLHLSKQWKNKQIVLLQNKNKSAYAFIPFRFFISFRSELTRLLLFVPSLHAKIEVSETFANSGQWITA